MSDNWIVLACQSLITRKLPTCYPTIDDTARLLGVPVRTLQRRLRQDGLSYSQLVENTRLEQACYLLGTSDLSVAKVANLLGYAVPGSFSRAFRRWMKISPRAYRQRKRSEIDRRV